MIRLGARVLSLGVVAVALSEAGCLSWQTLTNPTVAPAPPLANSAAKDELPSSQAAQACLAVARNLEKNGDELAALKQYEEVLKHEPDNTLASRRLAVLYDRACEFTKADAEYRKLAKLHPRDPEIFNDWGYSYYERTRWKEAEQHLRHALELDPHHERAQVNLGLVLGQQGRYQDALTAFRAVVGEAEAHSNLAFVYWSQGKLDEARQECRLAQQLDPSCTQAQTIVAHLDLPPRPLTSPGTNTRMTADRASRRAAAAATARQAGYAVPSADSPSDSAVAAQPVYRSPSGTAWAPVTPAAPTVTPGGSPGALVFD